jgi:hypothetical protein
MAATEKTYSFDYTLKVVNAEGVEEKLPKSADATAMHFDTVADIVAYFESQEAGKGESTLVDLINNSLKATAIANMRASLTRVPAIPKAIKEKANEKLNDEEKVEFNRLMAKLGIAKL